MGTLIWSMLICMGLEVAAKLWVLASGVMPTRDPITIALDIAVTVGFIIWGAILLANIP